MKLSVVILSMILSTGINAQKGNLLCKWNEDGANEKVIPSGEYTFFKKSNLFYFLSNDNTNIYIDVKIEDTGVQNRILKQGMVIWINMGTKVDKKLGVHFPIGSQNTGGRRRSNISEPKINEDGSPVTPLSQANTIELVGFTNEQERRFPADNANSFKGSVKYDSEGILHYKMMMPIEKLPVRNSKDGVGAMPFTFGIEYGEEPLLNSQGGNMRTSSGFEAPAGGSRGGGGRSGGGGGRSGGGGQSGPPPGAGSVASEEVVPPVIMWIKDIQLTNQK